MVGHYLQPLLAPRSVALVGASERAGSLGSIVYRNLAEGGLRGELLAVNPKHRSLFGKTAYPRLLVALHEGEIVAVGRYAPDPDGRTAEFALVVGDAWQGQGLGRQLLERLVAAARDAGYHALYGHILEANRDMLDLARHLGFVEAARSGDTVTVKRSLVP